MHDNNLLMNQDSRENNSLPAPVVCPLSREWEGASTEGLGPLTHPPLILSASECYHHVDIFLPVKYYRLARLHTSALSTWPNSSLVSLVDAMACLLFILLSLSLYVYASVAHSPPHFHTAIASRRAQLRPLTVSTLIVFCKAAGKQGADEETLNRLLEALCTLQAEWSHCK